MKKKLMLLSSMIALTTATNIYAPQSVGATGSVTTTQEQREDKQIDELDEWFYTNKAAYQFVYRAKVEKEGAKDIYLWVFNLTNTSDEPIGVWFTAMNDMEIKVEDEFTIKDHDDDGIYQVELLNEEDGGFFKSVEGSLSDIQLKPEATISVLYYGQFDSDEMDDIEFYLEFKEWFNGSNTGKIYPYGFEESEDI